MNNQTFEFDENRDYLRLLISEKNSFELKNQFSEMNDFDVATFLTDLREDGEQLMVLTYLMLSKEQGASVFAELEPPEQELIINSGGLIISEYMPDIEAKPKNFPHRNHVKTLFL